MAFVSAIPLSPSARSSGFLHRSVSSKPTDALVHNHSQTPSLAPTMAIEFQSYSGGLDRISLQPYSITRYLFKDRPMSISAEDVDTVIRTALRHLFGNAYIMEEERAQFYPAESNYRCGRITAKEFARAVAKSETYRQRFFTSVTQFRFIELNFKHFLGRAPHDQIEYSKHFKIFAEGGYEAEIDSYFDDPEFDQVFGADIFPFTRFRGTYAPINQFNRMCTIEGGFAGSDKFKPQMLVTSLAANVPTPAYTVADGLPPIPNGEHPSIQYNLPSVSLERFLNELDIAKGKAYQLQIELDQAYSKLGGFRDYINPFKAMVGDMDITPLYGKNYGTGTVKVFSGQYEGAAMGAWGVSGVDRLNGPTRRPATVVAKKEKQLEKVKQLVMDLERRVAQMQQGREKPALTPKPRIFQLKGLTRAAEPAVAVAPVAAPEPIILLPVGADIDDPASPGKVLNADDDESGVTPPRPIPVSTKRRFEEVGRLPKELMEEIEAEKKASGKSFLEGQAAKKFPGDGTEMVVG